ncbi:hypothetical protein ACFL2A_03565 [Thermodesulfobacteriota bacterium]
MKRFFLFGMTLLVALSISAVSFSEDKAEYDKEKAEKTFQEKCVKCHPTSKATRRVKTAELWEKTVKRMQKKNPAWISDDEATMITEYLTKKDEKK